MALYFFLAGAAVSTSTVLWCLPIGTFASALTFAAIALFSKLTLPFYSSFSQDMTALWNLQAVHVAYSACTALCAGGYVMAHPGALFSVHSQTSDALPRALTALSAGFFGFVLWTEIHARLYKKSYSAIVHYTLLLVLFSAAAYKSITAPFLCVTLVSEINSVFSLLKKQCLLAGVNSSVVTLLSFVDTLTFFLCRLIPHAVLGLLLSVHPHAFASRAAYWLAVAGMVYMNARNAMHALPFYVGSQSLSQKDKQHAA